MRDKNNKPITGTEQDQIDAVARYFSNYPITFFGENPVKSRLCSEHGYDLIRDKTRLIVLTREICRIRMEDLARQNPGYQNYTVINRKSTTEAEPEDRIV